MSNMSYCRFRNTEIDVNDCIEALEREEISSEEESEAAKDMIESMLEYCRSEGIISSFDRSKLNEVIGNIDIEE